MIQDGTGKVKFIYPNDFEVRPDKTFIPMCLCSKSLRPRAETIMAKGASSEFEAKTWLRDGHRLLAGTHVISVSHGYSSGAS